MIGYVSKLQALLDLIDSVTKDIWHNDCELLAHYIMLRNLKNYFPELNVWRYE